MLEGPDEEVAYKKSKPMESLNCQTQIVWSHALTGGGRLLEVPTVRLSLGKFWCFG